jgi:hypothetical protein
MTLLTVNYRHSAGFKPHYINNAAVEETAYAVRAQLVSAVTDAITLSVLGDITGLNVNGIRFDLWISLDHPVSDHETGETVCGLCEFDPGAGADAASLLVSPVSESMTEELVLSTFGHELGHAVFEAPGWIAGSKAGPGLFDDVAEAPLKVYRMTTRDAAHLSGAGTAEQQNPPATVHETERAKEMRIAEYRANEFMGSLLVPRSHLLNAVIEMAPTHNVTAVPGPSLLDGQLPNSVTLKVDGDLGVFDLESLQKAIGKRFGVHGRFIRVRMERYGFLPGNRPH